MNQVLLKAISEYFKEYENNVLIVKKGKNYTYKEVFKLILQFKAFLNTIPSRTNILLIADNSLAWIIAFISILLSKHKLVLFNSNSTELITSIVLHNKCGLIITDKSIVDMNISNITTILPIQYVFTTQENKELLPQDDSPNNELIAYSESNLVPVNISYDHILEILINLGKQKVFDNTIEYLAYPKFTYNYILGLLLPLSCGTKFIIPTSVDEESLIHELELNNPEILILSGYTFSNLYRNRIEPIEDILSLLLSKFKIIRKRVVKKRLQKLFPNLENLIILNSSIPEYMKNKLEEIKFPLTLTEGRIKDGGISIYKNVMLTELNSEDINEIITNDIIYINEEECISASQIEEAFKYFSIIRDCLVTKTIDGKLVLLAYVNTNEEEYKRLSPGETIDLLLFQMKEINKTLTYPISNVIRLFNDFERDEYNQIKRKYYENIRI